MNKTQIRMGTGRWVEVATAGGLNAAILAIVLDRIASEPSQKRSLRGVSL